MKLGEFLTLQVIRMIYFEKVMEFRGGADVLFLHPAATRAPCNHFAEK
jgi:hypothetical protein